jgi:hypothetical protein
MKKDMKASMTDLNSKYNTQHASKLENVCCMLKQAFISKIIAYFFRVLLLLSFTTLLTSCFTVHAVNKPEDNQCDLLTKELEIHYSKDLSSFYLDGVGGNINSSEEMLIVLAAIPATTFVVSGSISVLGNMVHWVEKQGRCDDSFVRTFTSSINDSIISAGGMVMDSSTSFLQWLKGEQVDVQE